MLIYNPLDTSITNYYYNENLLKKYWLIEKSTEASVTRERLLELLDILTLSLLLNDYTDELYRKLVPNNFKKLSIRISRDNLKIFLNQKPSKIYGIHDIAL